MVRTAGRIGTNNSANSSRLLRPDSGHPHRLRLHFLRQQRHEGTCTDPAAAALLEPKSGGKANFTFVGDVEDCQYATSRPHLNLNCKGELGDVILTIHDDGSLTGLPGSFMPGLHKEK